MGKKSKRTGNNLKGAPPPKANARARESAERRRHQKQRLERNRLEKLVADLTAKAERYVPPVAAPPRKKRKRGLRGAARPAEDITLEGTMAYKHEPAPEDRSVNLLERHRGSLWDEPRGVGRELLQAIFERGLFAHRALERDQDAEKWYRKYLMLDEPDHCGAAGFLLLILLERGDLDGAEELVQVYGGAAEEEEGDAAGAQEAKGAADGDDEDEAPALIPAQPQMEDGGGGVASRTMMAYGRLLVNYITVHVTQDAESDAELRAAAQAAVEASPCLAHALLHAKVFLDTLEDAEQAYLLRPKGGSAIEAIFLMSTELLPLFLDTRGAVAYLRSFCGEQRDNGCRWLPKLPFEVLLDDELEGCNPGSGEEAGDVSSAVFKYVRTWNTAVEEVQRCVADGVDTAMSESEDEGGEEEDEDED